VRFFGDPVPVPWGFWFLCAAMGLMQVPACARGLHEVLAAARARREREANGRAA
jgi:hypothetical protein